MKKILRIMGLDEGLIEAARKGNIEKVRKLFEGGR
jgi:hypothetical protein